MYKQQVSSANDKLRSLTPFTKYPRNFEKYAMGRYQRG